jgi:hypothetical protein
MVEDRYLRGGPIRRRVERLRTAAILDDSYQHFDIENIFLDVKLAREERLRARRLAAAARASA